MFAKTALIAILAIFISVVSLHGQPPVRSSIGPELREACRTYGDSDVIFIGRVEAPVTYHISGEREIEKARQKVIQTTAEVERIMASLDPVARLDRERELAIMMIRAEEELNRARAMYPRPYDLTLTPAVVEQPFRGVIEAKVMLRIAEVPGKIQPGALYLIHGNRSGNLTPPGFPRSDQLDFDEYVDNVRITPAGSAQQDVRLLPSILSGATIMGTLSDRAGAPLTGVRIAVSAGTRAVETTTGEEGSFIASGLEAGRVIISPRLADDLGIVNKSVLTFEIKEHNCRAVGLVAALNGRVRGRVISATGSSLDRLQVVLQQVDLKEIERQRFVDGLSAGYASGHGVQGAERIRTSTRPSEDGTFEFSGQIPGSYILSAHIEIIVDGKARSLTTYYPGTPDLTAATPITIGKATLHDGFDFLVSTE